MEHIFQLIQSYFNFRAAVLRSQVFERMASAEFTHYTGLDNNAKYRRMLQPDLWQPAEIYALARKTGLWEGGARKLDTLADLIAHLPPPQQRLIIRAASLTGTKLQLRRRDPNLWQTHELVKLQTWYHKNATQL